MTLEIQFLGSGDAFGSGGRMQACISLRWADSHVLLDCGATSLVALKRAGLDPESVDAVLISHLHGDHFGGLPFLALDQQFSKRERPLVIGGPVGTRARVDQAMEALFPGSASARRRFAISVVELEPGAPEVIRAASVEAFAVDHASGAPALALRVRCGDRLIAYSGDTSWTPNLVEVARGADVFICEAYTLDKPVKYHLDYATLRQHRADLTCNRLVLTHLGPEALARRDEIDAALAEIADDGLLLSC